MKLLASFPASLTIEQLQDKLKTITYCNTIILTPVNATTWSVTNGKGLVTHWIVRKIKSRYRFESTSD